MHRFDLLRAVSAIALSTALATAVEAADGGSYPRAEPAQNVWTPKTYLTVEGGLVTSQGVGGVSLDKVGDVLDSGDELGGYGAFAFRRQIDPVWDWEFAGVHTDLKGDRNWQSDEEDLWASSELRYTTLDVSFGYNARSPFVEHIRLFAGVRGLHSQDEFKFDAESESPFVDRFVGSAEADFTGIGPRIGLEFAHPVGELPIALTGDVAGAVLFGDSHGRSSTDKIGDFSEDHFNESHRSDDPVYNLEGSLGVTWNAAPNTSLTAGYRAQQWWGIRNAQVLDVGSLGGPGSSGVLEHIDDDELVHGPFLRLRHIFYD